MLCYIVTVSFFFFVFSPMRLLVHISTTSCDTHALHGLPNISYSLWTGFLKAFPVHLVVQAVVPVCKCVTYSLPFNWLRVYSFFLPNFTVFYFSHSLRYKLRLPRLAISYWTILFKKLKYNTILPFVIIFPGPCKSGICTACEVSSDSFEIPPPGLPYH